MSSLVPEKWREALERVQDKVGSLLDNLTPAKKEEGRELETMTADAIPAFMQRGGPVVDMHETDEELVIRAEVPGMKKEDFTVELVDRRLTIRGEKKVVREEKGGGGFLSECRYGSFARSITLPYPVDERKISADLKHGVLTIRLPKPEGEQGAKGHRIPVS